MNVFKQLRQWARRIKRDAMTLWFACRHPHTPWYSKALALFVVAYALSPIDLIPDFIPVLGYVDDVLLLPVLIWLALRTIPTSVLADSRLRVDEWERESRTKPRSRVGAVAIVCIWIILGALGWFWWSR